MSGFDIGAAEVPYDLPLGFDAEGATSVAITLVSKNAPAYKDKERMLMRMGLKKSAVRGRVLDLKKDSDADDFLDDRDANNIALAVVATTGWYGLTNAGAEYPYSAENAKDLYTKNSTVRGKVLAALEDQSNFLTV